MSSWILPKDLPTIPPLPGVLSKHSQNPGHSVPAPSPCGTTQSCPEGKSIFSAACAQWWAVHTLHLGKAAIARSNFPSHAKLWHHYVSKRMEKPCRCKAGTESSHPPHLTKSRTHKSSSWPCSQASLDSMGGQKLGDENSQSCHHPLLHSLGRKRGNITGTWWAWLSSLEGFFCVFVPFRSYFKARIALSLSFSADHDCHLGLMEDQLSRACKVSWWVRRCKMKGLQTNGSWACS